MSQVYPVAMNIVDSFCAVVGGGAVAERKVLGLLEAGAIVRVVSPELTPHLRGLAEAGAIEYHAALYSTRDIEGAILVFAATNVREVNSRIAEDAKALGLPVNVADSPEESSFQVPAVVRRGEFCLSISTGGSHPMLAARLAQEMRARFGEEYGAFVELLGEVRDTVKEWTADVTARRDAASALLDHEAELREHLAAGRGDLARTLAFSLARAAARQ